MTHDCVDYPLGNPKRGASCVRCGRLPNDRSVHTVHSCDAELRRNPGYDPFRCEPAIWLCSCGREWMHVCDEAEGCSYVETALA